MKQALIVSIAGLLLTSAAFAAPADRASEPPPQARIPFANHDGIEDWQAAGDKAIFLKGHRNQWFRAELIGYCPGLDFATTIGFQTSPNGDFDSFSSIIVRGQRCPVKALVRSGPPPKKTARATPES